MLREHVAKYLQGGAPNIQEATERMATLVGGDVMGRSMGHGQERERTLDLGEGRMDYDAVVSGGGAVTTGGNKNFNSIHDIRNDIMEDMNDYAATTGQVSLTNNLMNIRESSQPQGNQAQVGQQLATAYYNAFIKSLQNPSTQANLEVYKSLKAMLEHEQKLKGTQNQKVFVEGVRRVTNDMYKQLKG